MQSNRFVTLTIQSRYFLSFCHITTVLTIIVSTTDQGLHLFTIKVKYCQALIPISTLKSKDTFRTIVNSSSKIFLIVDIRKKSIFSRWTIPQIHFHKRQKFAEMIEIRQISGWLTLNISIMSSTIPINLINNQNLEMKTFKFLWTEHKM